MEMTAIDLFRNKLIDKILTIYDVNCLIELTKSIEVSNTHSGKVSFTDEQLVMLQLSDTDMSSGKLFSQTDLIKTDLEWLKGL